MSEASRIKAAVQERYSVAAQAASGKKRASCCGGGSCAPAADMNEKAKDFISRGLYSEDELGGIPLTAHLASLGCGNPTALAQLNSGETVLDLGSGGGIDVLMSAKRVGANGFVYGLDMTDEMLQLAEQNRAEAGIQNVKFLKGEIEQIPLPDNSIDVIISNCVINLSADKDQVLQEAFRVLKRGGRFAVSDMVIDGELPETMKNDMLAWSGCIAGALSVGEYKAKLSAAGFRDVEIEPTRIHTMKDIEESGYEVPEGTCCGDTSIDGKFWSAFVRAVKS
jgi:ubiquinone/menaquinone biosynthesis C-methylase UbiE